MINPLHLTRRLAAKKTSPAAAMVALFITFMALLTVGLQAFVTSRVQFGADFHTFWLAARAISLEGRSPYDPDVTLRTQLSVYGRPALPGEDPLGFVYFPYSLLPVLPAVPMAYPWAQAFWMALNLTLFLGALYLAFPGLPRWLIATAPLFYPAGYGLIIGNFALMIGSALLLVYAAVTNPERAGPRAQFAAGVLLAWTTVKPQMTWLLILFFLIYALRDRAWAVWGGFSAGVIVFLALSWPAVPGWPGQWMEQVRANADELQFLEPLALTYAGWVTPRGLAWIGGAALVGASTWIVAKTTFQWWRGKTPAALPLAWSVLSIHLLHPLILSPDQIIALLPLLAWLSGKERRRGAGLSVWGAALVAPWLMFFLPLIVWDSFETTKYLVTKGPPFLFGLWATGLLLRVKSSPGGE